MIEIKIITENKKQFIDLLLLADEEEKMIDRYLDRGKVFVLYDDEKERSICVVTHEGEGIYELKNLATYPSFQKMGYARHLVQFIFNFYKSEKATSILVGTGNNTPTVNFYKKCGFEESHILKNFFTDNYSKPIIDEGILLVDMIYLKKNIQ